MVNSGGPYQDPASSYLLLSPFSRRVEWIEWVRMDRLKMLGWRSGRDSRAPRPTSALYYRSILRISVLLFPQLSAGINSILLQLIRQ